MSQTAISFTPKHESNVAPKATEWSLYMLDLYRSRQPPPLGSVRFEDIEAAAKKKLEQYPGAFDYAGGSAGTNSTYRANLRALEVYRIIPRMLRDCTVRTLEVQCDRSMDSASMAYQKSRSDDYPGKEEDIADIPSSDRRAGYIRRGRRVGPCSRSCQAGRPIHLQYCLISLHRAGRGSHG